VDENYFTIPLTGIRSHIEKCVQLCADTKIIMDIFALKYNSI